MLINRPFRTSTPSFANGGYTLAGLRGDDDSWYTVGGDDDPYVDNATVYANDPITREVAESSGLNVAQLISAISQGYGQLQLQQINVKRAQAGLPPLNAAAYAPGVNVGLTAQTQKLVMYGGLALLGVLVLNSFNKRRT